MLSVNEPMQAFRINSRSVLFYLVIGDKTGIFHATPTFTGIKHGTTATKHSNPNGFLCDARKISTTISPVQPPKDEKQQDDSENLSAHLILQTSNSGTTPHTHYTPYSHKQPIMRC